MKFIATVLALTALSTVMLTPWAFAQEPAPQDSPAHQPEAGTGDHITVDVPQETIVEVLGLLDPGLLDPASGTPAEQMYASSVLGDFWDRLSTNACCIKAIFDLQCYAWWAARNLHCDLHLLQGDCREYNHAQCVIRADASLNSCTISAAKRCSGVADCAEQPKLSPYRGGTYPATPPCPALVPR